METFDTTYQRHRFTDAEVARAYVLGGHGTVTAVSRLTGKRYTFRLKLATPYPGQRPEDVPQFVGLLTGSDAASAYTYLGLLGSDLSWRPRKPSAPAAAFGWLVRNLRAGRIPDVVEVWHEGRCCRCGQPLTVPESIAAGIGPICAKSARS